MPLFQSVDVSVSADPVMHVVILDLNSLPSKQNVSKLQLKSLNAIYLFVICSACVIIMTVFFDDNSVFTLLSGHNVSAPCGVSVDQPERVNVTAEEDVEDDDDDVPDIRTFSASAEESHLYADRANGTADRGSGWVFFK